MSLSKPPSVGFTSLARLPFFYGWVVVGIAFVTMAIGVNSRTAFSLLYPPILDEFGWLRGTTAAAFSIGFLVSAMYAPLIGLLMDRWGPRYVISVGALLVSVGLASATLTTQPWHLHASLGAMVVGGSIAMSYIGHGAFLPNWFVRRRGLAMGIAYGGVGFGSIVILPWVQALIDQGGWRHACSVLAIIVLAIVPLNLVLQRRRPQDLGLLPDGDQAQSTDTKGDEPAEADRPESPNHRKGPTSGTKDWTLASATKTAAFWWLSLGFLCGLYAWYAVQVHQTRYLIDVGFGKEQAAFALALVAVFGILGQIGIGYVSDRIGREWAWTIGSLGFVLCFLLLLRLQGDPDPALMYAMVMAQGLLGYGLAPVYAAIAADMFQGRSFGTIFGTLSLSSTLGAAAGPWGTGFLFDQTGSYVIAFWVCVVLTLISVACIWCSAPRKLGRQRS